MNSWYYIYNYFGLNPYIDGNYIRFKGKPYIWYGNFWDEIGLGKDMYTFLLRNFYTLLKKRE